MRDHARLSGINAIVFDVFGTLAEIQKKRRPFAKLLQLLRATGREAQLDDAARLMSSNVGLVGAVQLLGGELPAASIAELERDLYTELSTITLYPEVVPTLTKLRNAGYKLGLCSNLAAPYAVPIKLLLPFELDAYAWSFEVGAVKPELAIYEKICISLECEPKEVLMVGDTLEADYHGPRQAGLQALYLSRKVDSPITASVKTLDELLPMLD